MISDESGNDKLTFLDAGILRSHVSFSLVGNDLLITIADPASTTTKDQIKILGWLTAETNRLETLTFADGSKIGLAEMIYRIDPANTRGLTIGGFPLRLTARLLLIRR